MENNKVLSFNRIKSLDGLRAISIILVLLSHIPYSLPKNISDSVLYKSLVNGHTGVMIFFVISGYLITRLLIYEQEKTGDVNLKNFYIRRFLRIFPVFYIYILVLFILRYTFNIATFESYETIIIAGLYLWNYKHLFLKSETNDLTGSWFMGHLWSLSMEEQFYLIWPFVFKKICKKKLTIAVIILILIMPLIRVLTYYYFPNSRGQIGMMLQTGGDSILIGCLLALTEKEQFMETFLKFFFKSRFLVIIVFIFVFLGNNILVNMFKGSYVITVGLSLENVAIALMVIWLIRVDSSMQKILNNYWFTKIGSLSYSLYIWQQLILTNKNGCKLVNMFPNNLICLLVLALFSSYFIEKPFLKMKSKFSQ